MVSTQSDLDFPAFAQSWVDSVNREDKDTFKSMWTDDAVWESRATGFRIQGPEAIADWMWEWIYAFPGLRADIVKVFGAGNNGLLELTLSGTQTRELRIPGMVTKSGPIPASGKSMTWPVCFVVEMRDGKVATFTFYADILTLISQLGAVPGPRPA